MLTHFSVVKFVLLKIRLKYFMDSFRDKIVVFQI
jgi:hypothetical protein